MSRNIDIRKAAIADLPAVSQLISQELGNDVNPVELEHWYWRNPSNSSSFFVAMLGDRCVGMATINDHHFSTPEGAHLIGMPQKVLTSADVRGKGVFGKLYRSAEKACWERGCSSFLTITNAASTPIFLQKFGYKRTRSPRVVVLSPLLGRSGTKVDTRLDLGPQTTIRGIDSWHMRHDQEHLKWRYAQIAMGMKDHQRYEMSDERGKPIGAFAVKRITRKGIPMLMLLDLWPSTERHIGPMFKEVRKICRKEGCVALMVMERTIWISALRQQWPRWTFEDRFNVLVKGKDDHHTETLAQVRYDLSFGDLDFI